MRAALLVLPVLLCAGTANVFAQSYGVGVGTTNPLSTLHVSKGGGLTAAPDVFTPADSVALSGVGIRMFWAPAKLAFRAGEVNAVKPTFWDNDSIGYGSFGFGGNLLVRGTNSTSFGYQNETDGFYNTSFGAYNIIGRGAPGSQNNFVVGLQNDVVTSYNTVFGTLNKVVLGLNGYSFIHGNNNLVEGEQAFFLGSANKLRPGVYGGYSLGHENIIKYSNQVVVGSANDTTAFTQSYGYPFFQVALPGAAGGRGTSMMVTSFGNVGINVHEPLARLHVDGPIIVGDNQGNYAPHAGMIRWNALLGVLQVNAGPPTNAWTNLVGSSGGSSAGWLTNGNAGTDPANDFIGTTDAQPLVLRVSSERAGYIDPGSGFSYSTSFGMQALRAPTSGFDNVAIGWRALYRDTSGSSNTAVGRGALYSNYGGSENVAIGTDALFTSTASRNVAVGYNAANLASSATDVVAIGHRAASSLTSGGRNIAIGTSALRATTDRHTNIAIGDSSLLNNASGTGPTQGNFNTAVGRQSLAANTTGFQNVAIGPYTLHQNTTGQWNVAIGSGALDLNPSGSSNIAIGNAALGDAAQGSSNIAIGTQALYRNAADFNTAIGSFAMYYNEAGVANTAVGNAALFTNESGSLNTALGHNAMRNRRSGVRNTAIGHEALQRDTFGRGNVALGAEAMRYARGSHTVAIGDSTLIAQDGGERNIAIGSKAAPRLTTGSSNIALGSNTLAHTTTQYFNLAIGDSALYRNGFNTAGGGSGWENVGVGDRALRDNALGYRNTGLGSRALMQTTGNDNTGLGASANLSAAGDGNTAVGSFAGYLCGSCQFNTVVGASAMTTLQTGSFNTILGGQADVVANGVSNSVAIGYQTIVNASNKMRLGNSLVMVVEGPVGYTFPSDGRFKKDVSEAGVPGLEFIRRLKPVSYHFDYPAFSKFLGEKGVNESDLAARSQQAEIGFIAQDVERLVAESGVVFNGVHTPTNPQDNYSLSYAHFVMPLVKAVQEQQAVIEAQGKALLELREELQKLREKQELLEKR